MTNYTTNPDTDRTEWPCYCTICGDEFAYAELNEGNPHCNEKERCFEGACKPCEINQ